MAAGGRRPLVYGFLLVALAAGAGVYVWKQQQAKAADAKAESAKEPGKDDKAAVVPVELEPVAQTSISHTILATANLRALREVEVATQIEGVVARIAVEEGDQVEAGQLLSKLDDAPHRIRLELTRQKLAQARVQLEKGVIRREKAAVQVVNAKAEVDRYDQAFAESLVSAQSLAEKRYRLDELEHDLRVFTSEEAEFRHRVEELEAEIAQVELEIERTSIRAPFAGQVIERRVELGQSIRAQDPLFKIGAFSPLYADVHLSEIESRRVHEGQTAEIRPGVEDTERFPGRVVRINPVVEQSTGTRKVTLEVGRAAQFLRPGAFVRVEIITDTRSQALVVPKKAIIQEDGASFVFVADGDVARKSKVELGYERAGVVEIRTGLASGQKIVVAGQGGLKDNAKIRTVGQPETKAVTVAGNVTKAG